MIEEYFVQWISSNVVALSLLFLCWKYQKLGQIGFGIVFLIASIVNVVTAVNNPHIYLDYKQFALLDLYVNFIDGFFAKYTQEIVLIIAFGQLLIAVGLLYGKRLFVPAVISGMIFSLAIIPLGIGSGLPVPIIMILSLWMLIRKRVTDPHLTVT